MASAMAAPLRGVEPADVCSKPRSSHSRVTINDSVDDDGSSAVCRRRTWWRMPACWATPRHGGGAERGAERGGECGRATCALKAFVVLALCAAVAISALMFHADHARDVREFEQRYDAAVSTMSGALNQTVAEKAATALLGAKFLAALPRVSADDAELSALYADAMPDLVQATQAQFHGWLLVVPGAQLAEVNAAAAALSAVVDVPTPHVWEHDAATGAAVPSPPGRPRYAVLWQHTPAALRFMNVLSMNTATRSAALDAVIASQRPTLSGLLPALCSDPPGADAPGAMMYALINSSSVTRNDSITGCIMASVEHRISTVGFHWTDALQAALSHRISGVAVVLRAPSGAMHTFRDGDGGFVSVAPGDAAAALVPAALLRRYGRVVPFGVGGDGGWSVTVYPTAAQYALHVGDAQRDAALVVCGVLTICLMLFAFYELVVRRKAARLNETLRTNLLEVTRMQAAVQEGYKREAQVEARLLAEEAASAAKEAFTAMVSHEIRTPLNGVSGAAALLALTRPLSGEQRELLDLLQAGATQVVLIVEDILLHGALASGNFPVHLAPTHLAAAVVEPTWRLMRMQAAKMGRAHVVLTCHVDAAVPAVLLADGSRLTQVITNLISNALKFVGADAGARVALRVDVVDAPPPALAAAAPQQRWLRIAVADTGCGIDPAHLERIFEPFRQETESTVRQYGGTGLGLTICRRLAAAMHGDLSVHSAGKGHGATFTFAVPLLLPSAEDAAAVLAAQAERGAPVAEEAIADAVAAAVPSAATLPLLQAAPPPPLDASALRILVAEDDGASRFIMQKLLARLRANVTCVCDGAEAVEAAAAQRFDLILMDLHMPRLDGMAASAAILAAAPPGCAPTIVALTASCSEDVKAKCAAAGMTSHLSKPINLPRLEALLRELCGARLGAQQ